MNEWIKCSDRLPEVGTYDKWRTHVLILAGERVLEGYRNKWGTWSRANGANTQDLPPVTHWMPLPEPADRGRGRRGVRWIDVEYEPPSTIGQKTLIYPIDGEIETAEYIGEGFWRMWDLTVHISQITHWMELPGNPKNCDTRCDTAIAQMRK